MYQKLTPLKQSEHASLRLKSSTSYTFAREEVVAPFVIDEVADVAREYPIVFPLNGPLPAALMGVRQNANAYVGRDGQWLAGYVPAHIRHYPLAMVRIPDAQGAAAAAPAGPDATRFAVLLDVGSSLVTEAEGEPIFDTDGKLTGTAQQKVRLMDQMQSRAGTTRRMVAAIEAAGLLAERALRVQRVGEPASQVKGLRVIDEAALNQLDDAAFGRLRHAGALPLVYAALLSLSNLRRGPMARSGSAPQSRLAKSAGLASSN